jgi:predicted extracellular nuclease
MSTPLDRKRQHVLIKVFMSFLAALLFALSIVPAYSQNQISVGAWNIQYLGAPNCRPKATKKEALSAIDIANFIIASGVDVLGLEEITDDDGLPNTYTNYTLTRVMEIIRQKTGDTWEYMLFRKFQGNKDCKAVHVQLTGVAWNTSKVTRESFKPIPIDTSSLPNNISVWNRPPVAVKFSFGQGKTDIVFIVTHMKSNVGDNTATTRGWEAKLLMEQLSFIKNQYGDDDIVSLGDTNVLGAQEAAVREYVEAGFTDLNSEDMSTSVRQEPFDRIFLRTGQAEFDSSRQEVFGPGYLSLSPNSFLRRLSDHYMVTTKINVVSDDDP